MKGYVELRDFLKKLMWVIRIFIYENNLVEKKKLMFLEKEGMILEVMFLIRREIMKCKI